jgi:hypothetical protein
MGTRNLTIVKLNGMVKLSKYCQWDGYPNGQGQGQTVLAFIRDTLDLDKFKKAVDALSYVTQKQIDERWVECGAEPNTSLVNMEVSQKMSEKYPQLQRDMGATILEEVQNGNVTEVEEPDTSFLEDTLFCEWAYELDLDEEVLYVYNGKTKPSYAIAFDNIELGFERVVNDYEREMA